MTRNCRLVGQIHRRSVPKPNGPLPLRYLTYQPAGHDWALQFIEMGLSALAGPAIAGDTLRTIGPRVRRPREVQPMRTPLRLLPSRPQTTRRATRSLPGQPDDAAAETTTRLSRLRPGDADHDGLLDHTTHGGRT